MNKHKQKLKTELLTHDLLTVKTAHNAELAGTIDAFVSQLKQRFPYQWAPVLFGFSVSTMSGALDDQQLHALLQQCIEAGRKRRGVIPPE